MVLFPHGINMGLHIRKQEEKEELLKTSLAYPLALNETGWKNLREETFTLAKCQTD